jgi:hypothetical protein
VIESGEAMTRRCVAVFCSMSTSYRRPGTLRTGWQGDDAQACGADALLELLETSVIVWIEMTAHRERTGGTGLVFPNGEGKPLHPSNVATRVWQPLRKRAGVSEFDMYSLRHTFASLGRTAGESAFNMSRMMGHSRSTLIDQVYAHSLQSGMASAVENVTARALGVKPQLRVIEGGQRDVRQPLDEAPAESDPKSATA